MRKRILSTAFILCLLLALLPTPAQMANAASGPWGENLTWSYDESTTTLTISGQGMMGDRPDEVAPYLDKLTHIIIEEGVTAVSGFQNCTALAGISLPDTVAAIADKAFLGCTALSKIDIPNTVNYIGSYAFSQTALTEATIPEGVVEIDAGMFEGCAQLTAINLPNSLLQIGAEAFSGCSALLDVQLPARVGVIGKGAFRNCTSLTQLPMSDGLESIKDEAFAGCTGLTEVIIPAHTYGLDDGVFAGCTNLTTASFLEQSELRGYVYATVPGHDFFKDCPNLTTINFGGPEWFWDVYYRKELDDPSAVTINCSLTGGKCGDFYWTYHDKLNLLFIEAGVRQTSDNPTIRRPTDGSAAEWDAALANNPFIFAVNFRSIASGAFPSGTVVHYETQWRLSSIPSDLTLHKLRGENGTYPPHYTGCTSIAKNHGYYCDYCSAAQPYAPRPVGTAHNISTYQQESTCTATGLSYGKQCTNCGQTLVTPLETPALGHDWGGTETIIKKPTCINTGSKTITAPICKNCGAKSSASVIITIPATGHTEVVTPAVPATCTTSGKTEGKTCSECQAVIVASTVIPTIGHVWGEETEEITKDAACTKEGVRTYTKYCTVVDCGGIETRTEVIAAAGHSYSEWITTKEPTATEAGSRERTCSACGDKQTEIISATDHEHLWGEETSEVTKTPTCTEEGVRTYSKHCTVEGCTEVSTRTEAIAAAGHSYGEWTVTKEPTATEAGSKEHACSACGNKQTEVIPATGAISGEDGKPDDPKTCTITFDANGGTGSTSLATGTDGKLSALPSSPTRAGCTFDGWYTAKDGGAKVTTSTVFQANATVYAHWTQNTETPPDKTCTITFDANGGSGGATLTTGTDGKLSALPGSPSRTGYTFDGWYTAVSSGEMVTTSTAFQANATVYAHWIANSTYVAPGGSTSSTLSVPAGHYRIYTPSNISGGTLSVSHNSAPQGTRVTIKTHPQSDFQLDSLFAANLNTGQEVRLVERSSSEYTFIMPASAVEVAVSYASQYNSIVPQASTGPNAWYYKDRHIYHVTDGLVPDATPITRDMLVSVLYNMTSQSIISGDATGSETNDSQVWATDHNILPDICASGLWGIDKPLSREQTAMLIFSYAKYRGCTVSQRTNLTGYADCSQVRPIAQNALSWALATGLMTSTANTTLSPQNLLTCGQAGALLFHFLTNVMR